MPSNRRCYMPADPKTEFHRLIDSLEQAADAARRLAFLRADPEWLKVDELLLRARKHVIGLYEQSTKLIIQGGRIQ